MPFDAEFPVGLASEFFIHTGTPFLFFAIAIFHAFSLSLIAFLFFVFYNLATFLLHAISASIAAANDAI